MGKAVPPPATGNSGLGTGRGEARSSRKQLSRGRLVSLFFLDRLCEGGHSLPGSLLCAWGYSHMGHLPGCWGGPSLCSSVSQPQAGGTDVIKGMFREILGKSDGSSALAVAPGSVCPSQPCPLAVCRVTSWLLGRQGLCRAWGSELERVLGVGCGQGQRAGDFDVGGRRD